MFEYIAEENNGRQHEIWVCEACRKRHSSLILEGKWRLINKSNDPKIKCSKCFSPKPRKD